MLSWGEKFGTTVLEVVKARTTKYRRRWRDKGRWRYEYGRGDRHDSAGISSKKMLGDTERHYSVGSAFSAGPGMGHYHITAVSGDSITVYLDEDKEGKRGAPVSMTKQEFREKLVSAHISEFKKAAKDGLDRRKQMLSDTVEFGTPKQQERARQELARWVEENKEYLPSQSQTPVQAQPAAQTQREDRSDLSAKEAAGKIKEFKSKISELKKKVRDGQASIQDLADAVSEAQEYARSAAGSSKLNAKQKSSFERAASDDYGLGKAREAARRKAEKAKREQEDREARAKAEEKRDKARERKEKEARRQREAREQKSTGGDAEHDEYLLRSLDDRATSLLNEISMRKGADASDLRAELKKTRDAYKEVLARVQERKRREEDAKDYKEKQRRQRAYDAEDQERERRQARDEEYRRERERARQQKEEPKEEPAPPPFQPSQEDMASGDNGAIYRWLGVKPGASSEEVKDAYREKAKQAHPDRGGDPEDFKRISAAYEVLSNPQKRDEYDSHGNFRRVSKYTIQKALLGIFTEVFKARATKYLRRYKSHNKKTGKTSWRYVYPTKRGGKSRDRHAGHETTSDKVLGVSSDKHYHVGASFAAGKGNGHYVITETDGNNLTLHLDEDAQGKRGPDLVMSRSDFRALLRNEHYDEFERGAKAGLKARQDLYDDVTTSGIATPKQIERAAAELHRWTALHKPYLKTEYEKSLHTERGRLLKVAKDLGYDKDGVKEILGISSLSDQAGEATPQMLSDLRGKMERGEIARKMPMEKPSAPESPQTRVASSDRLSNSGFQRSGGKNSRRSHWWLLGPDGNFVDIPKKRGDERFDVEIDLPPGEYVLGTGIGGDAIRDRFIVQPKPAQPKQKPPSSQQDFVVRRALTSVDFVRGAIFPLVREIVKARDIDLTPTAEMAAAAKRGLELREKAPQSKKGGLSTQEAGKQGIGSGVARASSIIARKRLSPATVRRMKAFFDRHSAYKHKHSSDPDGPAHQSWLLWGGDAGYAWAKRKVGELDRDEVSTL